MLKKITSGSRQKPTKKTDLSILGSFLVASVFITSSASAGFFDTGGDFEEAPTQSISTGDEYIPGQSRVTAEGMNNIIKALKHLKTSVATKFVDGTTATDAVFTGGNVGIGTNSPTDALEIVTNNTNSGIYMLNNGGRASLRLKGGNPGGGNHYASVQFSSTDGEFVSNMLQWTSEGKMLGVITGSGNIVNSTPFKIFHTGSQNDTLVLKNGNVGIGATSPTSALQLGDSSSLDTNRFITFGKRETGGEVNLPFMGHYSSVNSLGIGAHSSSGGIGFFTGNSSSVFDNSKLRMFINPSGNIGIGTTTPTEKLDVNGNVRVNSRVMGPNSNTEKIQIGNFDNNGDIIGGYFDVRGTNNTSLPGNIGIVSDISNTSSLAGFIRFTQYDGSTWTDRMVIDKSGNVGIGTSDPQEGLTLQDKNIQINTSTLGGNQKISWLSENTNENASIEFSGVATKQNAGNIELFAKTESGLGGLISLSNQLRTPFNFFTNSNRFGINTDVPKGSMHIVGNTVSTNIEGNIVTEGNGNFLEIGQTEDFGVIDFSKGFVFRKKLNSKIGINNPLEEYLRINDDGNVGIGTSTPTEKLDVNGNIKATGLAGTYTNDSAYVCVNNAGVIYASEIACP